MTTVTSPTFSLDVRAVTADVSNFVWTPTKDGSGNILTASWNNLPLNAWCEVASTNARTSLTSLLTDAGWNPALKGYSNGVLNGTAAIDGTFNAWCGMALDAAGGRAWVPWGGGHGDSSVNGIWRLDLEKMAWAIEAMPSDPDSGTYPWNSAYKAVAIPGGDGTYTQWGDATGPVSIDADGYFDKLPDGKPTSRHQYNGCTFDSTRGRIMQHRLRQWRYAISGGTLSSYKFNTGGTSWTYTQANSPGNFAHYDATNDATYAACIRSNDSFGFYKIAHATDTMTQLSGVPPGYSGGHSFVVRDRLIYIIGGANQNRSVFNMDTETWSDTGAISGWVLPHTYDDEMQPAVWVPDQSKILFQRRRDQLWYWIDPATWAMSAATFGGKTVPFAAYMGSKVFYYPARKVVVYVRGGNFNNYVMRVG